MGRWQCGSHRGFVTFGVKQFRSQATTAPHGAANAGHRRFGVYMLKPSVPRCVRVGRSCILSQGEP
eukprot:UN2261